MRYCGKLLDVGPIVSGRGINWHCTLWLSSPNGPDVPFKVHHPNRTWLEALNAWCGKVIDVVYANSGSVGTDDSPWHAVQSVYLDGRKVWSVNAKKYGRPQGLEKQPSR